MVSRILRVDLWSDQRVVTKGQTAGDVRHGTGEGPSRTAASYDSFGTLFEPGLKDALRRTLVTKVVEALNGAEAPASERIPAIVDAILSERESGWHLSLSPDRLLTGDVRETGAWTRQLCTDCRVPGCCYFDVIRLTSADVERLRAHLNLSLGEFIARHCVPYARDDPRYRYALKKGKRCEFLAENGRCRVYAGRPAVCAAFPFVVDPKTHAITEIRLFPFCNVPFNVLRHEVTRRVRKGIRPRCGSTAQEALGD